MTTIKVTISKARRAIVYEQAIPYSHLSDSDRALYDAAMQTPDPYAVLRAKTVHLADLLGCSEEDAEAILLDRIGSR